MKVPVLKLIILFLTANAVFYNTLQAQEISSPEDLLRQAQISADSFKSVDLAIKSLESDIRSRDLELSAIITSELAAIRDERQNFNANSQQTGGGNVVVRNTRGEYGLFDSTYIKPFDTGTELQLGVNHNLWMSSGVDRPDNQSEWQVSLSQSLWRNAFGRNTDLRRQADRYEFRSRYLTSIAERQALKQDIEDAFWDLVLARKEVDVNKQNLQRSQKLYEWIQERVNRFAAEEADRIQVETLLSERQLDLTIAQDANQNAVNRLRQLVPEVDPSGWKLDLKILDKDRATIFLLAEADPAANSPQPVLVETLASRSRAEQLELQARRVEDSLKPDLAAYVLYGSNGANDRFNRSWEDTADTDSNMAQIGLQFSMQLDFDLRKESADAAKYGAESEKSKSAASDLKSKFSWNELERKISSLKSQVAEARRLSDLQKKKVAAEKERFEQGRSTTFQMVSFELDASESELRLCRLLANLRKAENQARLFILADM